MKKIILFLLLFPSIVVGQGLGYKSVKECIPQLNETEKKLLIECARVFNVEIDSLTSIEDIFKRPEMRTCSITGVVIANYQFENVVTKEFSDRAVYSVRRKTILDKPRFMIFVMTDSNGSQVTLQKYY